MQEYHPEDARRVLSGTAGLYFMRRAARAVCEKRWYHEAFKALVLSDEGPFLCDGKFHFLSYKKRRSVEDAHSRAKRASPLTWRGGGGEAGLPVLLFMKIGKRRRKRREENDGF